MKKSSENKVNDLLQQWLKGDMTRRQERALEEKAKNNPFLADAMEGFRTFPEEDYEAKMANLQNQLKQRYQKKEARVVPFYGSRVAAMLAFAVVAGAAFWFLNQNIENNTQKEMVLQEDENPQEKKTIPAKPLEDFANIEEEMKEAAETSSKEVIAMQQARAKKQSKTENKKTTSRKDKRIQNEEVAERIVDEVPTKSKTAAPPPPAVYSIETDKNLESPKFGDLFGQNKNEEKALNEENISLKKEKSNNFDKDDIAINESEDEMTEEGSSFHTEPAMTMTAPAAPQVKTATDANQTSRNQTTTLQPTVQGLITDNNGEPLIGANIIEIGTTNGTVTDFDGRFQLSLQVQPSVLDINYVGFMPQQITVEGNENDINVQLDEGGIALDEVVVTGINSRKKESSSALINKAAPQNGFSNFKKYVKKNIKRTEDAIANNITGTVKIQFTIDANGLISNFKVLKSLGYGLDEAAILLLKEGGRWSLPMGQNSAVETYSFKFKK